MASTTATATTIPATHRAALLASLGPDAVVEVKDVPTPTVSSLQPGECLIEMEYSSVCHSDLSIKNKEYALCALAKLPLVGGHEGVGKIVAMAEHTAPSILSVGQRVGIRWAASSCLTCDACRRGSEWLCPQAKNSGLTVSGTFQQYVVGNVNGLVVIPDGVSSDTACPILCAGVTVYKALKRSNTLVGDWVAIPGAGGGLGHLAVQYARAMGLRVVAIDTGAEKKALCESLGAQAWVDFKEVPDVVKAILEATGGRGVKAAIIAAASAQPYTQAMKYLAAEGTLVAVGGPADTKLSFDVTPFVVKAQRIQGTFVGNRQDAVEALALVAAGQVKPHFTIRPLNALGDVYEQMSKGQLTGRVVLDLKQ